MRKTNFNYWCKISGELGKYYLGAIIEQCLIYRCFEQLTKDKIDLIGNQAFSVSSVLKCYLPFRKVD